MSAADVQWTSDLNLINVKQVRTAQFQWTSPGGRCSLDYDGLGAEDFVFENSSTGVHITDIRHGFKSTCREAGIHDLTFHDLRHTFGTRLAEAGVDIVKIAELMGHQSILTTRPYICNGRGKAWCDRPVGKLSQGQEGQLPQIFHKRKAAGLAANRS